MSNPRFGYGLGHGSRLDMMNSKGKLGMGMSNGSLDSRVSGLSVSSTRLDHHHHHGPKQKSNRVRRSVYLWTVSDVRHWLHRKHRLYYDLYSPLFQEHDISGRALVRLNEMKLERMGITNKEHRNDLHEHILKLRIRHEQNELRLLKKPVDKD